MLVTKGLWLISVIAGSSLLILGQTDLRMAIRYGLCEGHLPASSQRTTTYAAYEPMLVMLVPMT
jgi:hypothetical protein